MKKKPKKTLKIEANEVQMENTNGVTPNKEDGKPLLYFEERRERVQLSREEVLKRMADFPKRRDKIIAAIRKAKD